MRNDLLGIPKGNINELHLTGANGFGSARAATRLFVTTLKHVGGAIRFTHSSTEGTRIYICEDGLYFMTYTDGYTLGQSVIGISLNVTSGSTPIASVANSERLIMTALPTNASSANDYSNVSFMTNLKAGDIIRAQTDGNQDATSNLVKFVIVKVA